MQAKPSESNATDESNLDRIHDSSIHHLYLIKSWLNKFEKTKLEYYSLLFGISGLSFLALGISILIIISTTYEHHLTNRIDCSILNITHTHIKLCDSYRCRVFNYCIPYVCTIIFVRYYYNNISYESKLFPYNIHLNSSCTYEPSSCISHSRIQFEQIQFLQKFLYNISQINQCCLHSLTHQPTICQTNLNSLSIISIIVCFFLGFILILLGIVTQLHLNNYFKTDQKNEENSLDTIFNFQFSNGSIEKTIPVNYDILTQTISQHNTPSTTKIYSKDNLLLFDIEEENE